MARCRSGRAPQAGVNAAGYSWRGGRAVDCAGLENRKAERPREFESHPLRRFFHRVAFKLCSPFLFACANEDSNAVRLAGRDSAGLKAKLQLQSQSAALDNLTPSALL